MKHRQTLVRLWAILAMSLGMASSALTGQTQSIFDHLQFDDILKVEIETNIDSVLNSRKLEAEIPATFSYKDDKGKTRTWKIDLTVRGKFRRRICPFPPLNVQFKKKELKAAGFNDHNDLKLVTHCVDNDMGDENVLREYLVYKMYQILSDVHYKVQLVRIKYRDTDSNLSFTHYGILLEDEDEMKERYASKLCKDCYSVPQDTFQTANANTHDLFQYMIGNTDWSTTLVRNLRLLIPEDGSDWMIVPYDFDFSGVVNATYATPDPLLGIVKVRQRKFLGFAKSAEELAPTFAHFKNKEDDIRQLIWKFKPLGGESRYDILTFIESFYTCVESEFNLELPCLAGVQK